MKGQGEAPGVGRALTESGGIRELRVDRKARAYRERRRLQSKHVLSSTLILPTAQSETETLFLLALYCMYCDPVKAWGSSSTRT